MNDSKARWAGRNQNKDVLRQEVWSRLEVPGTGVGSPWSCIPDFVGAEQAAARLSEMPYWKSARVIKSNPDRPQIPVRRRALEDGKLLYTPVPELVKDFPFLLLDPTELKAKGVSFAEAAVAEGALRYGKRVQFQEMLPMDVIVVGSVAVSRDGARIGKGGGFADLELGIFRELKTIQPGAPIVSTVHDIQVAENDRFVMQSHDSPLDYVFTPTETIKTSTRYPQPHGVSWDFSQPDQYRDIPFLRELREKITGRSVNDSPPA